MSALLRPCEGKKEGTYPEDMELGEEESELVPG